MKMIVCLLGIILSFGVFAQSDLSEVQMRFENSEFACLDVIDGQQYLLRFNNYNRSLYLFDSNNTQLFMGRAYLQYDSMNFRELSLKLFFTSTPSGNQVLADASYSLSSQESSASIFFKGTNLQFKNCRLSVYLKSAVIEWFAGEGANVDGKFAEILAKDVGVLSQREMLKLVSDIDYYHVKFKDPQPFLAAVHKRMLQVFYDQDLVEYWFEEVRKSLM